MLATNETLPIKPYADRFAEEVALTPASFRWWHVLLVEHNREQKSAKWLDRNVHIDAYWPSFPMKRRCRGKAHSVRLHAVVPGLLFVPEGIMEIDSRDEVLRYAHSHGFLKSMGVMARLSKSEIEIIREIEAKLNLPPESKGVLFNVGQKVRFTKELYAAFWGTAIIFEIASKARIGVEVEKVIGGPTKVYVPASEIEAM